jgi:hypothetical protein
MIELQLKLAPVKRIVMHIRSGQSLKCSPIVTILELIVCQLLRLLLVLEYIMMLGYYLYIFLTAS